MFIGAQVSLYPMTSDFVDVILSGLDALTPYRQDLRIETDDMSTLMVGAPEPLLDAIRDLFAATARRPEHVTVRDPSGAEQMMVVWPGASPALLELCLVGGSTPGGGPLSRGCPGEPDDPSCHCEALVRAQDLGLDARKALALEAVAAAPVTGVEIDLQFSLYVLGQDGHMDEIYGCIDFVKGSGTYLMSKNFCTRLRGAAGAVFETLRQAFLRFGPAEGHVTIDMTASANSPSKR